MKSKTENRGGARPGSGRPKKDNAKQTLAVRVPPDVRAYLDTLDNKSATIDAVVRATRAFKRWKSAQ